MSDCIFCRIVAGTIPARRVHEDDELLAFHDAHPQAPVHVLIIPKRHLASLNEAAPEDAALLGRLVLVARRIAADLGVGAGYRVVTNCGASAGQSVFHLHYHLLGGRALGWPPG